MRTELFSPSTIRYGITAIAFFTSSEKKYRPIRRLAEYTVLSARVMMLRLAVFPTSTVPSSRNETTEAWLTSPHSFGSTTGSPFSTIDTQEYEVPRSMPIAMSSAMHPPRPKLERVGRAHGGPPVAPRLAADRDVTFYGGGTTEPDGRKLRYSHLAPG